MSDAPSADVTNTEADSLWRWWKSLPGVLTAITGFIGVVATLIGVLHSVGWIGQRSTTTTTTATTAATAASASELPRGTDDKGSAELVSNAAAGGLMQALRRANIGNSVGDAKMSRWLKSDDRYRRLAEAIVAHMRGKRLARAGADLDKIYYFYALAIGLRDGDDIPADHAIMPKPLGTAMINAFNDKNGAGARTMAEALAGSAAAD
jgi:hypothetical protein